MLHFPVVPSNIMAVETMFAWKLRVIIFVVIATSLFVIKYLERTTARKL